jgi:hypothetical protein
MWHMIVTLSLKQPTITNCSSQVKLPSWSPHIGAVWQRQVSHLFTRKLPYKQYHAEGWADYEPCMLQHSTTTTPQL